MARRHQLLDPDRQLLGLDRRTAALDEIARFLQKLRLDGFAGILGIDGILSAVGIKQCQFNGMKTYQTPANDLNRFFYFGFIGKR